MAEAISLIQDIARLLIQMGAEVNEDFLYVTVAFRSGGVEHGLQFTKRLFSVSLNTGEDGRLYYGLRYGGEVVRVTVLPFPLFGGSEADLKKRVFPRAFWDRLWRMAHGLRKVVFVPGIADVDTAWRLLMEVQKTHKLRPRRETLLLQRVLREFIFHEAESKKEAVKTENAARQAAYEELLRLIRGTPHSLNVAKKLYPGLVLTRINIDYWRADAVVDGEEFSGWGADPLGAASDLMYWIESEEKRRARNCMVAVKGA